MKNKIVSRVDQFRYINEIIYFTLADYPLELWYDPYDDFIYDILCDQIDEYAYFKWTYSTNTMEIYEWNIVKSKYLRV